MRSTLFTVKLLICGMSISTIGLADSFTYAGSFTTPDNTLDFTITIDTDSGTLTSSDFLSGTISDSGTLAFPSAPITIFGTSDDLSATPTGIYYDFSATDFDITQIFSSYYVDGLQLRDSNSTFGCYADGPGVGCGVVFGNGNSELSPGLTGDLLIAAAANDAPEPATIAMMLGGAVMMGIAALRRGRQAQ
ncbi:MAG TPA: PEP-CTERM sorting domain-containing protein [Bryobacteraceae bacterium]|jgi:hypothetical protein|nr:PEP-CTERM sorting domain-containing protein [Bryobacteraceae bacterium]